MGAGASLSLCQSQSSVRVLKHSARVEPEPQAPDPDPRAVFGIPLSKLREAGKLQHGVPVVLKNMVEFLEKNGLQQSGVFRVCGSAPRCKLLRLSLDRGEPLDLVRGDVPTVAALLKLFLRELPCGLIPNTHSKCMQQALTDHKGRAELFEALKETLNRLPDDNYNILSYLLHFLSRVAAHSQWNHMTSENLATVFGPCIFRVPEGPKMLEEQTVCNTLTLYLLEKHKHLMPNTHSGDLTLPPPPIADMAQLHQVQSCNLGAVCDSSTDTSQPTDHSKDTDMKADLLTAVQTQALNSSNHTLPSNSDESEAEKRTQEEERQTEEEPPSPNHNNNNKHSHTPYSNTHSQSGGTHLKEQTSNTTHSRTKTKYTRSHTYTPNRDTHTKTSDTLPETITSHSQSNNTHTLYSSTDSQSSGGTHSDTSNRTGHTHPKTRVKYTRSHTYTPNRSSHTKTTCHTHSTSSHTLPETSSSHRQSQHTHCTSSNTLPETSSSHRPSHHTHSTESSHTLPETSSSHKQSHHTHSTESSHTLPDTSSSHKQSHHTHSTESSHTLPDTSSSHKQSHHTHSTESSHTLPDTSSSHKQSHHTHSTESSHTLPDTSSSHKQSHHTHSTESSHTLPETSSSHRQSQHTHCTSSNTLPETSSSHRQSHHTHSTESSHTLPETSSSHRQSHHIHSTESSNTQNVDTQEKGASPPSGSEQPTCDSRAPIWRPVGALPSPHAPILSQNQHLSSEQGSVSSSQSQVMSDCISSKNSAEDSTEPSVSLLQRRIHNLKQAVRGLDNSFQYTQYYKAGRNDKVADPRVASLMIDLDKARKQLTDLQSRQCVDGSVKLCSSSTVQQGVSVTKPALEDTVKTLTQHLKEKRLELNLPERLQDMSLDQLALEKMTLQKSLLYYESLHGRPRSKEERSVMRDLYDRYHLVKQAFYSSNRQTNTMSGDKGLDKLIQQTLCSTLPTQEASNPAFISQLEEIKLTTAQTNNTHSINRAEILMQLKETRVEKRRQRKILKEFEETVLLKTGKSAQREDRVPMAAEYDRYETLKARLKLLKRMLGQTHTVKAAG
ncbi:protein FAM13A isoform X2 [Astyanax mexicanus]|uniref:protein FAM13A isoform X2 n=1 Tax=Astyanax mexicanus TaxID=7994 RepID=UPI0020CB520D|nr:protein FAM13A isoform X2 [Astyanax mexicanus]